MQKLLPSLTTDESVCRALRRLVQSEGWQALTFATAEEFLQAPSQPPHVCLILDLCLPGLSGWDLKKQLDAERRNVPVIFITAFASEQIREQALQAGAIAFLSKPLDGRALLNAIALAIV
jgi:FixJ family two-component response regulator